MAKLTQTQVKEKADKWAAAKAKIAKAEKDRSAEIEPYLQQYNEDTKPIVEKYDAKIGKLQQEADALETELLGYLSEQTKDVQLDGKLAVAERKTETKIGSRVIDVQKFLETAKSHGSKMWECVSVAIKKAEDLIGKKEVDAIATKPTTTVTTTTLRLK